MVTPEHQPSTATFESLLQTDQRVAQLKNQLEKAVGQFNQTVEKLNQFLRSSQARMQSFEEALQTLTANDQKLLQNQSQSLRELHRQVQGQKTDEVKITEMLDRHNTVLQRYERKIADLERRLAERDEDYQILFDRKS